ncbi:hypothetical protein ACYOEI_10890 [Singulisphaera rosea]
MPPSPLLAGPFCSGIDGAIDECRFQKLTRSHLELFAVRTPPLLTGIPPRGVGELVVVEPDAVVAIVVEEILFEFDDGGRYLELLGDRALSAWSCPRGVGELVVVEPDAVVVAIVVEEILFEFDDGGRYLELLGDRDFREKGLEKSSRQRHAIPRSSRVAL